MAAALLLTGYNLWDQRRAETSAQQVLAEMEPMLPEQEPVSEETPEDPLEVEIPDYILNPSMEMPTVTVEGEEYIGVVEIPALGLSLPVMSQCSDANLKLAPCRYVGSAYQENMVISGHNYRSHFGSLRKLQPGDEVRFRDGNLFAYTVAAVETLSGYAVEEMEAGNWPLTLFTCTMGGQNRLTVRCIAATE